MIRLDKTNGLIHLLLVVACLYGPAAAPAEAYIDPGTGGSMLSSLSILFGAVSACVVLCFSHIKQWGGWLVGRLAARRKAKHHPTAEVTES